MRKRPNKNKNNLVPKTVKLDAETHKLLRIYAAKNDFTIKEAVRNLLNKATKRR